MAMSRRLGRMPAMPVGAPLSGPGGRVISGKAKGTGWATLFALACLVGCRWPQVHEAPVPFAKRLTWNGRLAERIADSIPSDTGFSGACIHIQRLEFPGSEVPL